MTTAQFVLAVWSIAALAVYAFFCVWLWCKSDRIPKDYAAEFQQEQDDERSQRRRC